MNEFHLRELGYKWSVVYGVCMIMEESVLNSPIAVYDDDDVARKVAKQNSKGDTEFAVIEIKYLKNV